MAHNIYSDPDLSKTSGQFEGFTIDFQGIETPDQTYWSLCNFHMDLTEFKKTYPDAIGGGGYGGLQTTINDERTSILSFWEVLYEEGGVQKSHRAQRIYPKGDESSFGGEGEGSNYRHEFKWLTKVWYRYVLHSWVDSTGDTFVGQWIQNLSNNEWTLFAYFNTKLKNSYITGALSQFQENYCEGTLGKERSFQMKNMYAFDRNKQKWISLDTTTLVYDLPSWGFNTVGTHEIEFYSDYFYGSSGLLVDNQKVYDNNYPPNKKGTISQPNSPNFNKPEFDFLKAGLNNNYMTIFWRMNSKTSPCYKYQIQVNYSSNNKYINYRTYYSYKPENDRLIAIGSFAGKYQITVKCFSISNDSVSKTIYKQL